MGQEVLLEIEQRRAHRRDGGDMGGRLADHIGADGGIAGAVEIDGLGAAQGVGLVRGSPPASSTASAVRRYSAPESRCAKPKCGASFLARVPLPRRGGAVDGDDDAFCDAHGASITAPRPRIKS